MGVTKYNDKYSITQVFTREHGMVSYILPLSSSKKTKIKRSLFFPLSLIDIEADHKATSNIQRLREVNRSAPLIDICTNISKTCQSFFLAEFLTKILQQFENNDTLFDFIEMSVLNLEKQQQPAPNFHIAFMLQLSQYIGILPNWETYSPNSCFDMLNGVFVDSRPSTNYYLTPSQSSLFIQLRHLNYDNMNQLKLSRTTRNAIVDHMLVYYRLHLYDFPTLKSLDVLRTL